MDLQQLGKMAVCAGLAVTALGLLMMLAGRLGGWPRLPGDIVIDRPGLTVYVPLGTCVALSVLLTLVMWLYVQMRR